MNTRYEYQHEWYLKHREEKLKQQHDYHLANQDSCNKKSRLHYQKNKKRINQQRTIIRQNSIETRLANNLRTRISRLLKGNHKELSTFKLISCSIEFLKNHLETQFTEGMSWENYGRGWNGKGMKEWHIDHKIPFGSVNLNNPEEQKRICHWNNLQPMWALENIVKSDK